jgi:protein SCO1/2
MTQTCARPARVPFTPLRRAPVPRSAAPPACVRLAIALLLAVAPSPWPLARAQPVTPASRLPSATTLREGPASTLPTQLREVGFDQLLGAQVPLDARFKDELGQDVTLGRYFGKRPVLLALVYYECPMLCTMVLNGVVSTLKPLTFDPGKDFELVVVSFNPAEGPQLAAAKRANYLASFGRAGTDAGWHFLTGPPESIAALTSAVGFRYVYDEKAKQYAHATGITILTPQGKVARYLFGIDYPPKDLRLALVEAADGKIGNVVDQLMLYCFHYDPQLGRYSATTLAIVRAGGVITMLAIAASILAMRRRDKRMQRRAAAGVA